MAISRKAKLGTVAALALSLSGGIGALFNERKTETAQTAAVTAEIADVTSAQVADVRSDQVLARLFEQANTNLRVIVQQIRSGEGQVDTATLHQTIAAIDSQLRTEMAKPSGGDPRQRSRLVRALVDLQARLHSLDTDADFLVSYARMHQDRLTNMQRMYRHQPSLVSFCSAMTGYLNTTLRAPPAHHADWPTILLTLHGDTIEGLIAMVDSQTPQATTPEDKAALLHMLNTFPDVMARVPSLRRLIEKKTR